VSEAITPYPDHSRGIGPGDVHHPAVVWWLVALAALVFVMVIVGGATRLTGSGLSITEWRPVTGAIPPLSAADWALEFEKYRASPQYALLNKGMALAEFKFIYWWEWGHRQLGRFIGLFHVAGLVLVCAARWVSLRMGVLLFGLGLLLGTQGAVGWIMVASGLQPGMIAVAPVKLALHLSLACLYFMGLVYVAVRVHREADVTFRGVATPVLLLVLVFVQIVLGGFVAGSRAGFTLNTWPLLDGDFIPPAAKLFVASPWIENFVDNPTLVQFNHRMLAYVLCLLALWHGLAARAENPGSDRARRAMALTLLVWTQAALGIATLLLVVPLWAGLAHQGLAIVVLAKAVRHVALSR